MTEPLISIILITKDRSAILHECLANIVQQDYGNTEIIVIDNASSDDTLEMLARDFPQVQTYPQATNLGVPAGRNLGFQQARGEIGVCIDDDALFSQPDALRRCAQYFHDNEKLACIAFEVRSEDGRSVVQKFVPRRDRKIITEDTNGAMFAGTGFAFRVEVFNVLGGFWEGLGQYFGEEPDLSYRLLEAGYEIMHSTQIAVLHAETDVARPSGRRIYYGTRNTALIALRNLPWYAVVSLTAFSWGYFGVQAICSWHIVDYVKGLGACVSNMSQALKTRKKVSAKTIQQLKKYSGLLWY